MQRCEACNSLIKFIFSSITSLNLLVKDIIYVFIEKYYQVQPVCKSYIGITASVCSNHSKKVKTGIKLGLPWHIKKLAPSQQKQLSSSKNPPCLVPVGIWNIYGNIKFHFKCYTIKTGMQCTSS